MIKNRINELILREKPEKQIKYSESAGIARHYLIHLKQNYMSIMYATIVVVKLK